MVRLIDADKLLAFMKAETAEFRSYVSEYVMTDADRVRLDEMTMNQAHVVNAKTVEAIPIEWLESWSDNDDITSHAFSWADVGFQVIQNVIEDWRKENE